jgi:flagellar assembly protein FliH
MTTKTVKIVPLEYAPMGASPGAPLLPGCSLEQLGERDQVPPDQAELLTRVERLQAEKDALSANIEQQLTAARGRGYEAARSEEEIRSSNERRLAVEALTRAVDTFTGEQKSYFARVEREVVQLALSIAAHVLHREAQLDPLLLAGAVRVALGQLSEATQVRLCVPPEEAKSWTERMHFMPDLLLRVAVTPDSQMQPGDCRLETELGRVDLGVRAQLQEIERGFFDLLEQSGANAVPGPHETHSPDGTHRADGAGKVRDRWTEPPSRVLSGPRATSGLCGIPGPGGISGPRATSGTHAISEQGTQASYAGTS